MLVHGGPADQSGGRPEHRKGAAAERVGRMSGRGNSAGGRNVAAVTGETARFEMCPGLLEIRFYAAKNVPAYAYGPGLLSVAHGPNEYVARRRRLHTAASYQLTAPR